MYRSACAVGAIAFTLIVATSTNRAEAVYLNDDTPISVEVGPGTDPAGDFNNTFNGGATIAKVIDADSADAEDNHDQATHIWFTASEDDLGLELLFDFGQEYDISTLHFWNYTGEGFDVDNIDFTFFNEDDIQVGMLSIQPDLGTSPGLLAQDIVLAAPLNVQFVTAFLTGSNGQIDFQNIGFTAEVSIPDDPMDPPTNAIPEPTTAAIALLGLAAGALRRRTRSSRTRDT